MNRFGSSFAARSFAMLLVASTLHADPRWWTHDQQLTPDASRKTRPDITFVHGEQSASNPIMLVAYETQSGSPDHDIAIMASFNGGCTWCGPVAWVTGTSDDTRPQISGGIDAGFRLVINVVYERAGSIYVSRNASLDPVSPSVCSQFSALATPTPQRVSTPGNPGESDRRPRISAVSMIGFVDFHVVWEHTGSAAPSVFHSVDTDGDGVWSTPQNVTAALLETAGLSPDVASDNLTLTTNVSAATIAYQTGAGEIRVTRSTNRGQTWGSSQVVSGTAGQTLAAIDSTSNGITGDLFAWNGVAWQTSAAPHDIIFDAGHWIAPTTVNPDFEMTALDHLVSMPPDTGVEPALSVGSASPGGARPIPLYAFWTDERAIMEIMHRGGLLDALAPLPRDLSRHALTDFRTAPPPPATSLPTQLSFCDWSDGWPAMTAGVCQPALRPPTSVGASQVASADEVGFPDPIFATVFADDRTGVSQIYFKRTDGLVDAPIINGVTARCVGLRTAEAVVEFPLEHACDAFAPQFERLERYLLYYGGVTTDGATASGPFLRRAELPSGALPDPATFIIGGLTGNENYHFAIVVEDEARNITPTNFDPRVGGNSLDPSQVRSRFTPPCEPDLRMMCALGPDNCSGASDGEYNPGDQVVITLTFTNNGDFDASNVTGMLVVGGTTILSPPGGALTIPVVPAAGSIAVPVTVRLDTVCPPPANDLLVLNLASDGGAMTYNPQFCVSLIPRTCTGGCVAAPDLELRKTRVSAPTAAPGSTVRFDIALENTGFAPIPAGSGFVNDTFPTCFDAIGVNGNPCPTGPGAPAVTCTGAGCAAATCTITNGGFGFRFSNLDLAASDAATGGPDEVTIGVQVVAGTATGICSNAADTTDPADGSISANASVNISTTAGCGLAQVVDQPPIVHAPPWVYTNICGISDVRLDNTTILFSVPAGSAMDTLDSIAPGTPGELTLYQLDCACANDIYVTKNLGPNVVQVFVLP